MADKKDKTSEKEITSTKLRVVEALQDDAYKGIARIDPTLMKKLKLQRGDIISIKGSRESFAIVDRAYPADLGENIIRIDGITRKNAKTSIGEQVLIKRADLKEAKKITIAPAQQGIMVQGNPENIKQGLLGRAVFKGDILVMGGAQQKKRGGMIDDDFGDLFSDFADVFNQMGMGPMGGLGGGVTQVRFMIVNTNPNQGVIITENTEVELKPKAVEMSEDEGTIPQVTYEDIGGLTEEVKKIREMVELPLKHPEIFDKLGIEPPKGVLLYGPPGTGKTMLAKAVAGETEAHFILLNGPEIMSKFYGESEKKVREVFDEAEKNSPAIIFIDEIDSIAPKREDVQGEVERRVVSQLLTMMDGLNTLGKVVVIGATNRPNSLDPALRRPGRFDREIEVGVPDKKGRLAILKIHTRGMPLTKDVDLEELAGKTHGFVGADISALAKESAMAVLRRNINKFNLEEDTEIPQELLEQLKITKKDFDDALRTVRPSAMREVLVETPNVKWADVGGIETAKMELKEAVEWPMKNPASFERMGIKAPKGVLLYGPPGTGKTMLAKAVANESEANFIQVKGPELLSMWVGKSEEGVRKIFEKARQVSPCIIFFDEIDSLAGRRGMDHSGNNVTERVLNQMLAEMDGIETLKNVTVIGATNRPDMLDPALLRPGRFDRIVYVNVPEKEGRLQILKIHTKNMPLDKDVNLEEFAEKTEGYTGADIEGLTREAAMLALREDTEAKVVSKKHFEKAMDKVLPSVTKNDQERYRSIEKKYLRSAKSALPETSYAG
ncbi:VCP-like ATPase [uncultured archaeon]|nr:VCP-like ATPase [uncultured archaeon]